MSRFEDAINLANHLGSTVSDGNGYSFLTDAANVRFEPENISVEDAIKKLKSVDAYVYQGTVENYNNLPTENVKNGDVYNVENAYLTYPAGTNFAAYYDENKQLHWDSLGGEFSVPVEDVKVNGTSVVNSKVANINVPIQSISQGGVAITPIGGNVEIPLPTIPDVPVQDVKDSAGNSLVTNKIAVTETPNDKVVEITPEIKSSEIKYPSLKAITEWVDANKSELNFQYAAAYKSTEKTQYVVIDIIAQYDYKTNNNTLIKVREYAGADETTIKAVDYSMPSRIKKSSFSDKPGYTKYSAIFMWQNSPANYDLFQISIDGSKAGGKLIKMTNGNNMIVEPFLKYDSTNKIYYYGLKFNPFTDALLKEYGQKYYPDEPFDNVKSWFSSLGIYNCFLSETIEFGQVYRVCPFNGYIYSDLSDTVKNLPDCDVIYTAISDVQVNGTSVVENKIANISVPVLDVQYNGSSKVNKSGTAEIWAPAILTGTGKKDEQGNEIYEAITIGERQDKKAIVEAWKNRVSEYTTDAALTAVEDRCYPGVKAMTQYVTAKTAGLEKTENKTNVFNDTTKTSDTSYPTSKAVWELFKQGSYTAGDNITISADNKISAKDTTYKAGQNISIKTDGTIDATDTTYSAGDNITISADNKISTTYVGGEGINIDKNIIELINHQRVLGRNLVYANPWGSDAGAGPYSLYNYEVECELNGIKLNVANLDDVPSTYLVPNQVAGTKKNTIRVEQTAKQTAPKYIPFFHTNACVGFLQFKIRVNDTENNRSETHYMNTTIRTSGWKTSTSKMDNTGAFAVQSSLNWKWRTFLGGDSTSSTHSNTSYTHYNSTDGFNVTQGKEYLEYDMDLFLEIPKDFIGTVEYELIKYQSQGNYKNGSSRFVVPTNYVEYTSSSKLPYAHLWYQTEGIVTVETWTEAQVKSYCKWEFTDQNNSSGYRFGYYQVDLLAELGEDLKNKNFADPNNPIYISDIIVNDYLIHFLQKQINNITVGETPVKDVQDEWTNSLVDSNKVVSLKNYSKTLYIELDRNTVNSEYTVQWDLDGTYMEYGASKYYFVGIFIHNSEYKEIFINLRNSKNAALYISASNNVNIENGTRVYTNGAILPCFEYNYIKQKDEEVLVYTKNENGQFVVKSGWNSELPDENGTTAFRNGELKKTLYPFGRYFASYIYWHGEFYGNGYGDIKVTDYLGNDCALPVTSYSIKSELYSYIDRIKVNGVEIKSSPTPLGIKTAGQTTGQTVDLPLGQYSYIATTGEYASTTERQPFVDPKWNTSHPWPWNYDNNEYDWNRIVVTNSTTRYVSCSMEVSGNIILLLDNEIFLPGQIVDVCPIDGTYNTATVVPYYFDTDKKGWVPILYSGGSINSAPLINGSGNDRTFYQYRFTRTNNTPTGWYVTKTNFTSVTTQTLSL